MKGERTQDGTFEFGRELFDPVCLGIERATKQRVVLAPLVATDLSLDELRAKFGYNIEGVTPLLAIVETKHRVEPHGAVCVEALPSGQSLVEKSVPSSRRGAVAQELARIVAGAHERGIALVGLRPDLVFVGETITVVPRWASFLAQRSKRMKYINESFSEPTPADRFMDLTLGALEDTRVDVYLLGLLISWLWTDLHALDEDHVRVPWPGPPALDALIGSMLSRDPDQRPRIDEVVTGLARFSAI